MNIFVPHDWLLEHLETTASPQDIQRLLSLSGPSVERIHDLDGIPVYEIEITSNRMDTASVRGIAREAAVILTNAGIPSSLQPLPQPLHWETNNTTFPVEITDAEGLCRRVMAAIFEVKNLPSPDWMTRRLAASDISSHGILVDITNYLMLELGQPCHMFDADRVGKVMQIRSSKKGETFVALDDRSYHLPGGDIVVDNGQGVLTDLIGIKGAANSGVVEQTSRVLFFIEQPNPVLIRATSMSTGIRTEAAQLNEKSLDPKGIEQCFAEGMRLLRELAEGKQSSQVFDLKQSEIVENPQHIIEYPLSETSRYLGISLPVEQHIAILTQLGCEVESKQEGHPTLTIRPPSFRPDLHIKADIVEELARIVGYHNLPSQVLDTPIPLTRPKDQNWRLEFKLTELLVGLGWQEVLTYSHVSEAEINLSGILEQDHLKIANPLSSEHLYLRRRIWPSLVQILRDHPNRDELAVFELTRVFHPVEGSQPHHELRLAMATRRTLQDLSADLSRLFTACYIPEKEWYIQQNEDQEHKEMNQESTTKSIGIIQVLEEKVGEIRLIDQDILIVELDWQVLQNRSRSYPIFRPISPFQPVIQDTTITIPEDASVGQTAHKLRQGEGIDRVEFVSQYKRNFTFRIWCWLPDRQLTIEDAKQLIAKAQA